MIALTKALLRAVVADRVSVVLSLVAPVAFFTLIGSFYLHLGSPRGIQIELVVQDESGTDDGRRLAESIVATARAPVSAHLSRETTASGPFATVVVPAGFTRHMPSVEVISAVPFPGGSGLVSQLIELAALAAFGPPQGGIDVALRSAPSRLMQDASVGICLIFMMFSLSSLAAKGLADDAAGLSARLASLGVGPFVLCGARVGVMATIGLVQMVTTLIWAGVAFGIVPGSAGSLLVSALAASFAIAAFTVLLAAICGTRLRFAAVAPVVSLALAAGSGALIPRFVLPGWASSPGAFLFPSWAIDSSRSAMDGDLALLPIAGLVVVGIVASILAAMLTRWRTST